MEIVLLLITAIIVIFIFININKNTHESVRKRASKKIIKAEIEKAKLYDQRKHSSPPAPHIQPPTTIELLATSSRNDDLYKVIISNTTSPVTLSCNCFAGSMGTMCRHRIALLTNKVRGIFYVKHNSSEDIKNAVSLLENYGLSGKYQGLETELNELDSYYRTHKDIIKNKINELA